MEQCLRIAFWMMFLLTGYLQAQPVRERRSAGDGSCSDRIKPLNLGLGFLTKSEVSCSGTMNFTSPDMEGVKEECYDAALQLFIKGMQDVKNNCTHQVGYIDLTIETLENACINMNTTECNFTMKVHEQFGQFVSATKKFVQQWNVNKS